MPEIKTGHDCERAEAERRADAWTRVVLVICLLPTLVVVLAALSLLL